MTLPLWHIDAAIGWGRPSHCLHCDGDVERRFTKDELLAHVMLYWVTGTIGSSFLPYYDVANAGAMTWLTQKLGEWMGSSATPAAFAL